jgi:hypothetical protein
MSFPKIRDKLDEVCKLAIIIRDDATCFTCGKTADEVPIGWGHLLKKGNGIRRTRYLEPNLHAQCNPCNYRHELDFSVYLTKWLAYHGEDVEIYNRMFELHQKSEKYTRLDLVHLFWHWAGRLREECINRELKIEKGETNG